MHSDLSLGFLLKSRRRLGGNPGEWETKWSCVFLLGGQRFDGRPPHPPRAVVPALTWRAASRSAPRSNITRTTSLWPICEAIHSGAVPSCGERTRGGGRKVVRARTHTTRAILPTYRDWHLAVPGPPGNLPTFTSWLLLQVTVIIFINQQNTYWYFKRTFLQMRTNWWGTCFG